MINLSDLLSKRLIILNEARVAGIIEDVVFNDTLTAARLVKIYDDGGEDAETKYAEFKKLQNLNSDACTLADKSYLSMRGTENELRNNPAGSEVFNQDGKLLGRVSDVILNDGKVQSLVVGETELEPNKILSHSKNLIVINDSGKKIKLYHKKQLTVPKPEKTENAKVTVHAATTPTAIEPSAAVSDTVAASPATETAIAKFVVSGAAAETEKTIQLPTKMPPENTLVTRTPSKEENASSYKFLIGKTLARDIAADNGVIILRKEAVITDEVIASARSHNKLVQLALHAE